MPKDFSARLTRLESRVVNGFIKLGVDPRTKGDTEGIRIDQSEHKVYISDPSVAVSAIVHQLYTVGAPTGLYAICVDNLEVINIDYDGLSVPDPI
jgi:hypothetical protein